MTSSHLFFAGIMIASLSFLLDYKKIEYDDNDSDDESTQNSKVVFKAHV